jgi:ankyrin repeat protein
MKKANKLWNDYTPLMKYAANGMLELVKRLCEDPNIDINEQKGWNNVTALMLAAQNNHIPVIKYLIDRGADINLVNAMKNSALMLAADAGHAEAVKLLAEQGANIGLGNEYKHTALIIACEKGHLEVAKWIVSRDPGQVGIRNKYHKNSLLMAAEFGQLQVVKFLTDQFEDIEINIETKRGITPLMFAAGGGSDKSCEIVKILIAKGADVNRDSNEGDTAMIWAAIGGNASIIEQLHAAHAHVNHANKKGFTALMKSAERGHYKASKALIEAGADMWRVVSDVSHHDKRMDAMKLAWMNGHVELATNLFMIPLDKDSQMLSRNVTDIFNEDELEELAKKYANPSQFKSLKALVIFACAYDFHFDLFIKLIPRFKTPNTVLNKQMIIMYIQLFKQSSAFDVELVHKLVQLAAAFAQAAANHPLEKIDLQDRINTIVLMLTECLNSDCMDDERNVQRILCASISKREDSVFVDDLVEQAQAFLRGPLETCISAKVTALFCTGHVSTYVDNIFWGFLRTKHGKNVPQFWFTPEVLLPFTHEFGKESENIRTFNSVYVHFRFSPAAMFFGEGISKIAYLFLVAYVAVKVRNQRVHHNVNSHLFQSEIAMLIMTVSMMLYEYGQLCGSTVAFLPNFRGIRDYIGDIWNCLDISGLSLVSAYYILRFVYGSLDTALATLSLSTIFFAVSNMRYLSIAESVGKLIIMVFAMMGELRSFAIIFVIFVFGFCVTLYGLLSDVFAFLSVRQTLLTLFGLSVQNYDSTFLTLEDRTYEGLVVFVQVCYVLLTSVVLMNLIIARMSAMHAKIDDKSFEEWQYSRAMTVQQFMVVEERSPFCMLPAPFNLLPCIVFPLHAWILSAAVHGMTQLESVGACFRTGGILIKTIVAMGAELIAGSVNFAAQATTTVVSTAAHTAANVGEAVTDAGIASLQAAGNAALHPIITSQNLAHGIEHANSKVMEMVHDPRAAVRSSRLRGLIRGGIASGALEAISSSHLGEQIGDTFHNMQKFFAAALDEEEECDVAPWLRKTAPRIAVSLAGSVCDIEMGIVMAFFAPLIEFWFYQVSMITKMSPLLFDGQLHALMRSPMFQEYMLVTLTFPIWYFPFMIALLLQTTVLANRTQVQIMRDDDSVKFVVQYEKGRRYQEPEVLPSDVDKISIKVLRIEDLTNVDDNSNPVIKFRIGDMERVTGPSIYGGKRPAWSKGLLVFPLRSVDLLNEPMLTYEVVDKDFLTGGEQHIAECAAPIDIRQWIGNRSYEGVLELEKGAGKIVVVIKVEFPSFLQMYPDPMVPSASKFAVFKGSEGESTTQRDSDDDDDERCGPVQGVDYNSDADSDTNGDTVAGRKKSFKDVLDCSRKVMSTEPKRPPHLSYALFSEVDKERIFMHALRPRNKQGYQSAINYFPTTSPNSRVNLLETGDTTRALGPERLSAPVLDALSASPAKSGVHATVSGKIVSPNNSQPQLVRRRSSLSKPGVGLEPIAESPASSHYSLADRLDMSASASLMNEVNQLRQSKVSQLFVYSFGAVLIFLDLVFLRAS